MLIDKFSKFLRFQFVKNKALSKRLPYMVSLPLFTPAGATFPNGFYPIFGAGTVQKYK